MACASCGTTDGKFHGDDWVGAKKHVDRYVMHDLRLRQPVHVTRERFTDVADVHIDVCSACLFAYVKKAASRQALLTFGLLLGIPSAIAVFAMFSPKAGAGLRIFTTSFLVLAWVALGAFYVAERRRWDRHEYTRRDRPFLEQLAAQLDKSSGRDVLFTRAAWRALQRESERQKAEDDKWLVGTQP